MVGSTVRKVSMIFSTNKIDVSLCENFDIVQHEEIGHVQKRTTVPKTYVKSSA